MNVHVIAILCLLVYVNGLAYTIPTTTVLEYGVPVTYCTYDGLNMSIGSNFTTTRCLRCWCESGYYHGGSGTCAFGPNVFLPSDVCIAFMKACEPNWVMRSNTTEPCPRHLIPGGGI